MGGTQDADEIWYSERQPDGSWSELKNIGKPLNTPESDVLFSISPDGNTALLYGIYHRDSSEKQAGFSISKREGAFWGYPEPLKIKNYYNRSGNYFGYLAADNRTLLLSIQRDDAVGGMDLYVCLYADSTQSWSEPRNLGATINTLGQEYSPALAPDGKTLYFSSDGLGGFGKHDIFMSKRLDDSWTNWDKPKNLGAVFNSTFPETSFSLSVTGDTLLFYSFDSISRKPGIYWAVLPDSLRPEPVVFLRGIVKTKNISQTGPTATIRAFQLDFKGKRGECVGTSTVPFYNGKYALTLPIGKKYQLEVSSDGYKTINEFFDAHAEQKFKEVTKNFVLSQKLSAKKQIFTIYFEHGKSEISPDEAKKFSDILTYYKKGVKIQITGHTDDIGSDAVNNLLSTKRAKEIAKVLNGLKIPAHAMKSCGQGSSYPAEVGTSKEARKKNRRVEVIFE